MGKSPSTTTGGPIGTCYPVGATFRIVRIQGQVEEYYSSAGSIAAALADAKAQAPNAWRKRHVLQQAGDDIFEYDVVSSDVSAVVGSAAS